jgi:cytochrome P450
MQEAAPWFDLYDTRLKTDPYPIYQRLLAEEPFFTEVDGARAAIFSRYHHVEKIYGDYALFSSVKPPNAVKTVDYFSGHLNIAFSDPPVHTRLRRTLNPAFMPASVARLAPAAERAVDAVLDAVAGRSQAEVMADIARPLSQRIILGELLQIPAGDHHLFLDLATALFAPGGRAPGSPEAAHFDQCWSAAAAYCHRMIEAEKAAPTDGVLANIVRRGGPEGLLSDDEVLAQLITLLTGGFSTIASLIGTAFAHIVGRPDQLALLRDDPGLAGHAIEEVARHRAPGLFNYRFPTRDTELAGLKLDRDMPVYMLQGATSFDPAVFEDPFVFDIRRQPKRLLVFGHGIHHCIGAPVARLAARAVLREAVARFGEMELAEPLEAIRYSAAQQELSPLAVHLTLGKEG